MDGIPGISCFQGAGLAVEVPLQNQEEEEDLEDQKRRHEEIKNLLTEEMDEFKYDDQSTINSSTNISQLEYEFNNKYKECDMNDQLHVLYEVRVKEVATLHDQVTKLKQELVDQRNELGRKYMLSEADKDQAKLSLKQVQEALVAKCEEIQAIEMNVETKEEAVKSLEYSLLALKDERDVLKITNNDLVEQLKLMERNLLNSDSLTQRQLQEQHQAEINKLQSCLDNVLVQLERKENDTGELQTEMFHRVQERDEIIAEKADVINKLTVNLDDAQSQCRELLLLVETVSHENQSLQKIAAEYKQMQSMKVGLTDKTEIIKVLQKELDKVTANNYELMDEFAKLEKQNENILVDLKNVTVQLELSQESCKCLTMETKQKAEEIKALNKQVTELNKVEMEKDILESRLASLQIILDKYESKSSEDQAVQVSKLMNSFTEQTDIYKEERQRLTNELEDAKSQLKNLQKLETELTDLRAKASLENDREILVKALQEKALEFEKVIKEIQAPKDTANVGVNTVATENQDFLITKYETMLLEQENRIRNELEQEFQRKQENVSKSCTNCMQLQSQLAVMKNHQETLNIALKQKSNETDPGDCASCKQLANEVQNREVVLQKLYTELQRTQAQHRQDREIIAGVLDDWKVKFDEVQTQNGDLIEKLRCEKDVAVMVQKLLEEREHYYNEVVQDLHRKHDEVKLNCNKTSIAVIKMMTVRLHNKIVQSQNKVENISKKTDEMIKNAESKYKNRKKEYEKELIF